MAIKIDPSYSLERYLRFLNLVSEIEERGAANFSEIEKINLFGKAGVNEVRRGKIRVSPNDLSISLLEHEFSELVSKLKDYVNLHKSKFEEDVRNGKLRNAGFGKQLEFEFRYASVPRFSPSTSYDCFSMPRELARHFRNYSRTS